MKPPRQFTFMCCCCSFTKVVRAHTCEQLVRKLADLGDDVTVQEARAVADVLWTGTPVVVSPQQVIVPGGQSHAVLGYLPVVDGAQV